MSPSEQPLVTVVMPVTKTRFLAEAIESALGQDYPRLEVLALDDGSTDPAMTPLLERFAAAEPERFRFVRHENIGQSATINRGVELARGEIAGYLSDDDLLREGAVSRQVEALLGTTGAVVAYGAYEIVDEDGVVLDTITPIEYSTAESVRLHDSIVGSGALFTVEAFHRVGGWDTGLRFRADYDFWLKLGMSGKMVRLPEPLSAWRFHPKASTVAFAGPEMSNESLGVLDRLYAGEVAAELEAVRAQAYRNAFVQAALVLTLGGNDPGERFFVEDRHMPKISRNAEAAAAGSLSAQVAQLNAKVEELAVEIAVRGEALQQRDETIALLRQPAWRRLARRLVPAGARPAARRLADRRSSSGDQPS